MASQLPNVGAHSDDRSVSESKEKDRSLLEQEKERLRDLLKWSNPMQEDLHIKMMESLKMELRTKYEDREVTLKQEHELQLKEMQDELNRYKTEKVPTEGMRKRRNSSEIDHPNMSTEKPQDESKRQKVDVEAIWEGYILVSMKDYVKPLLVIIMVVVAAFVGAIAGAQNGPWGACVGSLVGVAAGILVSFAVQTAATQLFSGPSQTVTEESKVK